jgi:hypothetical protein
MLKSLKMKKRLLGVKVFSKESKYLSVVLLMVLSKR